MKKFITIAALLLSPAFAFATIITFTDQAAWQAAANPGSFYDFDSAAPGDFTSRDFGDFTANLVNPYGTYVPSVVSGELRLQKRSYSSELAVTFDNSINSLGFDWRNTDQSNDKIELLIDGQSFVFGLPDSAGFFGIIADSTFESVSFSDTEGNGGALSYGYLDNFQYGAIIVSEPGTLALLGLGLAGVGFTRRKKQ